MTPNLKKITVLGGGSWGTALGILLGKKGFEVTIFEYLKENVELIEKFKENIKFLPGVKIPANVAFTYELDEAIGETEAIILALPSHTVSDVLGEVSKILKREPLFVIATKGIETSTLQRMSELAGSRLPYLKEDVVVLSGPSFAYEVSRDVPTAVVAASKNKEKAELAQELLVTPSFRVYTNPDVIGVELGGSLKNVLAIACGISDGLGFGDNTKAALMTRGLAEIIRLGLVLGARKETFAGLSGMGDLIATCTSGHSRNRHLGEMIGYGKSLEEALGEMIMVAEGVKTTEAAVKLGKKLKVELPITEKVYEVLFKGEDPLNAVKNLMLRRARAEG